MVKKISPTTHCYVRDGVPGLPLSEQEATLVSAGFAVENILRDVLTKVQIKAREPSSLKERKRLLSDGPPTGAMIVVPSLRVLGWSMGDICTALDSAGDINLSVHVLDARQTFTIDTMQSALLKALAFSEADRRRAQTEDAQSAGVEAAAAKAKNARDAKLALARPDWARPPGEISAEEIGRKHRISSRSLFKHLGSRRDAKQDASKPTKPADQP